MCARTLIAVMALIPAVGAHTKRTSVCRSSSVKSHAVPPVNTCAWYRSVLL